MKKKFYLNQPFIHLSRVQVYMTLALALCTSHTYAQNWTSLGPSSSSSNSNARYMEEQGSVRCICLYPGYGFSGYNIIFAGAATGGLWKNVNGGVWTNNSGNLPVLGVSDIVIDNVAPQVMYVATGGADNPNADGYSRGVYKTADGGVTWNPTGLKFHDSEYVSISKLIMNPSNHDIIFAATSKGLYETTNGGGLWIPVLLGNIKDIKFNTYNNSIIYATSYYPNYINYDYVDGANFYISTNNGINWTAVNIGGVSSYELQRIAIGVTPDDASYVYLVATASGAEVTAGYLRGVFLSTDSGKTFNFRMNPFNSTTPDNFMIDAGDFHLAIAVNPTDKNDVYIGGLGIAHSTDGFLTWQLPVGSNTGSGLYNPHGDIHAIVFEPAYVVVGGQTMQVSPSGVLAGNDGGIIQTNNGNSWSDFSSGLAITQIYGMDVSYSNPNFAAPQGWDVTVTGCQDNGNPILNQGSWIQENDNFGCWNAGDGVNGIMDYTNSNFCYIESANGGICKYTISTATSTQIVPTPIGGSCGSVNEGGIFRTPFIMHPTNSGTLLVGKQQLYRSTDGGNSWSLPLGTIPGGSCGNSEGNGITVLSYAPSNPNYIYVARNNNLYVTTNGDDVNPTWTDITGGGAIAYIGGGLPPDPITAIAVDPNNPLRVWVTFSGYDFGNKVWFSDNAGKPIQTHFGIIPSWINFSGSLPNLPVNCIIYDANTHAGDALYIGTDVGVYFRNAWMTDWIPWNTGLPNVKVNDLKIQYNKGVVRAATYGRGLWESPVENPVAPRIPWHHYISTSNVATLNLQFFIKDYYIGNRMMTPVLYNEGIDTNPSSTNVDTVLIELHDAANPATVDYSSQGILQTNGSLTCYFNDSATGNYYIVIKHRNALETWSNAPVSFANAVTNYDFSQDSTEVNVFSPANMYNPVYGSFNLSVCEVTGVAHPVYAIPSGDVGGNDSNVYRQDGAIDGFDFMVMDKDIQNGATGYVATDLNGDGVVDSLDKNLLLNTAYPGGGNTGLGLESPVSPAQAPGSSSSPLYQMVIKNITQVNPSTGLIDTSGKNVYFDIWINSTETNPQHQLEYFQAGIDFNYAGMANGGTISGAYLAGSADASLPQAQKNIYNWGIVDTAGINTHQIRIEANIATPFSSSYPTIPNAPGIKLGTFVIHDTVRFTASSTPNFNWSFNYGTFTTTRTGVAFYPNSMDVTFPANHLVVGNPAVNNSCITVTAGNVTPVCAGSSVNLSATVSGGTSPYRYSWSGPNSFSSTTQNYSITNASTAASGIYTITVTDTNGCSNTASVLVAVNPSPVAAITSNRLVSTGSTLNLNATNGGYSFSWSGPNGLGSTNQNDSILNATTAAAGTYTLIVTNGCGADTASTFVTVSPLPTVNSESNQTVCTGSSTAAVIFSGTGSGNVYHWTNSSTSIGLAASGTGNIPSFTATNNGTTPDTATITVTPVSSGFAYICNYNSNNVSVINRATDSVTATISIPIPQCIAVNPVGNTVYVTSAYDNVVYVINAASDTITTFITVGSNPAGVAVSPDGSRAYVANYYSNTVSVINTTTNTVASTITDINYPYGIAVSPDGSKVYVSNYLYSGTGTVTVINTATNSVTATIPVGLGASSVALSPDGSTLYVSNGLSNTVSVINTAANSVTATIVVGGPQGIAISPDGSTVYVPSWGNSVVDVINAATNTVTTSIGVGINPVGISVSPDGSKAYVTNRGSNTVSVISTATNAAVNTVAVGTNPSSFGNFVTGNNYNGTPATFTITVNPAPTASGNSPVCTGGTLYLSSGGGTSYSWAGPNGFTSTQQNPSISGATSAIAGTYTVTVTDACNGVNSASIAITVSDPPVVTANSNSPVCEGSDINLSSTVSGGTGSYSYSWNGPGDLFSTDSALTVSSSSSGTGAEYLLTVIDANGCEGSAVASVVINPLPTASISGGGMVCAGATLPNVSIALTGTAPWSLTYAIDSVNQTPIAGIETSPYIIPSASAGTYTVAALSDSNCTGTSFSGSVTVTVNNCNSTSFHVKFFIQGYYLGGGMMQQVLFNEGVDTNPASTNVDTIRVSLVDSILLANDPNDNLYLADTVATAKGILQTNGILSVTFSGNVADHKYYLMVTHRNVLQTWSANMVTITNGGFYDFTDSACAAYGCNEIDVYKEGIWSFYSGDLNQDQNIDIYDFPVYDFESSNFYYGYYVGDLNGDGNVDIYDFPIYDANSSVFIYSEHP